MESRERGPGNTCSSTCFSHRATILETPDTWYMDDQNLVLKICQDSRAEADDQGQVLKKCCACDEAKYEVTFEGLWSRNTHPKARESLSNKIDKQKCIESLSIFLFKHRRVSSMRNSSERVTKAKQLLFLLFRPSSFSSKLLSIEIDAMRIKRTDRLK